MTTSLYCSINFSCEPDNLGCVQRWMRRGRSGWGQEEEVAWFSPKWTVDMMCWQELLPRGWGDHALYYIYWHGEIEWCLVRLWLYQKLYIYMWGYDLDKIVFTDRLRRYTILPRPSSNYFMESVKIWISTFTDRPECLLLTFRDIRLIGINGGGKI